MFGEKRNLKSFNDREISDKNYFGEESVNNLRRYNPIKLRRKPYLRLNYKHLHI